MVAALLALLSAGTLAASLATVSPVPAFGFSRAMACTHLRTAFFTPTVDWVEPATVSTPSRPASLAMPVYWLR